MGIGQRLQAEITTAEKRGVTLYRIAKDAGIVYSTLFRFANSEAPDAKLEMIDALCDYFGLELRPKQGGKKNKTTTKKTAAKRKKTTKKKTGKRKPRSGGSGRGGG